MSIIPNTRGNPQFSDIASELALPVTGNPVRGDGQTALSSMDTLFGNILEDRSAMFVGGADISLDSGGTTLTFSERLDFTYNNQGTQETITSIVAAAGTITFTANGNMSYITLTKGSPGSATLTSNATSLPAATTTQEVFLLAVRRDDISGTHTIYFRNGPSVQPSQTIRLHGGSDSATTVSGVVNTGLTFTEISTPSNPSSGSIKVYAKSGDGVYTLNSAGTETQLGSGSGQKNYLQASTSTATGWTTVTGTGATTEATVTASTDTTIPDNQPRPYTTKTALQLVATAASGGTPVSAFAWATFQLDPADYNTKLQLQFAMNATGFAASGDYQVQVATSASAFVTPTITSGTRLSLSTDSSSVSALPNLEGTYRTTFDAPGSATPYIMVMFIPKTTATSTLYLSDLIVGPGTVIQGAAVSQWQNFTPTWAGLGTGTLTINTGYYRRVGDSLEVQFSITMNASGSGSSSVTASIPSGYTFNSSAIPGLANAQFLGAAAFNNLVGSAAVGYTVCVNSFSSPNNLLQFTGPADTNLIGSNMASGAIFEGHYTVPVNELAGSGTINVVQNDVEYLWNSDVSSTASVTASGYAYGPSGGTWGSGWTISSTYVRRIQTITPISVTDNIIFQVTEDGVTWSDLSTGNGNVCSPFIQQGTSLYGVQLRKVDSTHVDVEFLPQGRFSSNASYAGNGSAWSTLNGGTSAWRVVKAKSGQAVGFGIVQPGVSAGLVSASGVPGNTTGSSIAAGYVGQVLSTTASVSLTTSNAQVATLSITAGVWLLSATIYYNGSAVPTATQAAISLISASNSGTTQGLNLIAGANNTSSGVGLASIPAYFISISSTTSYFLNGLVVGASGGTATASFQAVRIA